MRLTAPAPTRQYHLPVAVVKINAIEVAPERGAELEERFARRASEVEKMPGFEVVSVRPAPE